MISRIAIALIACMAFAGTATAGDYGRPGPYVGVGGGAGFDFLKNAIENELPNVDLSPAGSFNAKVGMRFWSWFALEAMYEGAYGYGINLFDVNVSSFDTHSILGNMKFIVPIKRFQPYITIGPGAQYGSIDLLNQNFSKWDFVLRIGVGLDLYITEHWVVDLDLAPSVRFTDWSEIPSAPTDNVSLTTTVGVQYRF